MSEPKFLPGPWRWIEDGEWKGMLVADDGKGNLVIGHDAVDGDAGLHFGIDKPDARLIAAAPEMYALMSELLNIDPPTCTRKNHDCWECKATALLRRIEGEG